MKVIYPPNPLPALEVDPNPRLFLAGTIEMGNSIDWQQSVIDKLDDLDVTILNPRRKAWDSSWKQDPDKGPFREQVIWELMGIAKSDIVLVNFIPGSVSPISLLELGTLLGSPYYKALYVVCPPEYFRHGNVKITCELCNQKVLNSLDEALPLIINEINDFNTKT